MAGRRRRIHADTSVFGGVFDEEYAEASGTVFALVRTGRFNLVLSRVVENEIAGAPVEVSELFGDMLRYAEVAMTSEAAVDLQRAYLEAGIVSERYALDALHVALATVSGCSVIVSWNFRHIVHFRKVPMYNAVNIDQGYPIITICSPPEVIEYEEEEV